MDLHVSSICRWLTGIAVVSVLLVPAAHAQPAGGPYGPIEKRYEVPTTGNVYYVAPDGRANARGNSLRAPTTLESAIARVVTGDAIILRGGVYRTGNLELNQGITLQPYADERPILKGTHVATNWEAVGDNVWRTSWTRLFPSEPLSWWRREREEARTPLHRFNNDMVFVDGEFLQSVGSVAELDERTHFIDYERQLVYIGTDPANRTVEITAHDFALRRTAQNVHRKVNDRRGPVIRGITFTQYAWTAINVEGSIPFTHLDEPVDEPEGPADPATYGKQAVGTTLENVTISWCSRVAGYFRGDSLVIRNSLIHDTGTEGIYIIGSSDVLLERNIVLRNDIERITGYYVSAVKIINQTHNVVVRDNIVMDSPSSAGVWYDVGNRDGIFINNHIENVGTGFFFEISQGVTAAGNVFVNNRLGTWILNAADAFIYNNTYVDSPVRFTRTTRSAVGDHFDWHPATGPDVHEREGHVFLNNLLVGTDAAAGPLLMVDQQPALCAQLTQPQLTAMDGNVYVRPGTPYPARATPLMSWVDTSAPNCAATFPSLTAFQEQVRGFEAQGGQLEGTARTVFDAPDIRRFQLRRELPASRNVVIPESVRALLGWSSEEAAVTVGAHPAGTNPGR
jgi:hypothetical protein